ncbi:MAG TPA: GDSL-type esterase/lipase family protein [Verrucomicrobiae bacterium]|nr:GDSL-type esterase/lipase family protein [Verrucomicrobiae bacterium]
MKQPGTNGSERFNAPSFCHWMLISTALAANVLATDAAFPLPSSLKPESQHRDARVYDWDHRHQEILDRNRSVKPDVVFIGDSITHFWGGAPSDFHGRGEDSWKRMVGSHVASNLGFGFDYIDNAYYRVLNGELDGIAPKVIVVLLGTNNLGHRKDSPESCADNMRAFLDLLRRKSPRSNILLLGILPRGDASLNQRIAATNRFYSKMADGKQIHFDDVSEAFLPAGATAVSKDLMPDGVHPSAKGYELLGENIKTQLDRLGI